MNRIDKHGPTTAEFRTPTRIRLVAASLSIAAGVVVLIGWASGLMTLTQILPGLTAMNPLTAISFVVAGTALALHSRASSWCISALGAVVFAIGAAKLSQIAFGYPHGIDQLLFSAKLDDAIWVRPNRMAPNTALAFCLAGLALGASKARSKSAMIVSQCLIVLVMAIALFALVGYSLGLVPLYGVRTFTPMALHTAISFIVIGVGVLSCQPQSGLLRMLGDDGPAGHLARKVLPLAVLTPVSVGILRLEGERRGFYEIGDAIALQVFANVLVTFILLMGGIIVLYRSDLERRQREIEHRRKLELSRQRAEAAMNAKAAFVANMSHEIRTPLNSIIGFTDLILDDAGLAPGLRRQLDLIKNSGDALLTVVNDILDFSKMEAGKTELVYRGFNLRHLLQNTISIISQTAETKGLAIALSVHDDFIGRYFIGDEARLRQILLNLLSNAVKFTAEGRVVLDVALGPTLVGSRSVTFSVNDTGLGIPKDQESRLFQQFSQTETTISRQDGGTGLGLAICKSLVTLMGGTIGYRPTAKGGSQFWFEVQLQPTAYVEADADLHIPGIPPQMRILVVEDLAANQALATAMLTRSGHRVEIAENGKEAIAAVQARNFDLILMDIQMPVMDGLTATRLIRLLPGKAKTIPIIAISANVLPEQVEVFREAGMSDHLHKPIKLNVLNQAIARNIYTPEQHLSNISRAVHAQTPCFDEPAYGRVVSLLGPDRVQVHLKSFGAALEDLGRSGFSAGELEHGAHKIAGQAGMFGFMALANLCRQLETELRASRPCAELLSHVRDAIAQAQPTITQLQFKLAA